MGFRGYFIWPQDGQEGDRPQDGICGICHEPIEGGDKYHVLSPESLGHWECVWVQPGEGEPKRILSAPPVTENTGLH